jgi:hypothetical protein
VSLLDIATYCVISGAIEDLGIAFLQRSRVQYDRLDRSLGTFSPVLQSRSVCYDGLVSKDERHNHASVRILD